MSVTNARGQAISWFREHQIRITTPEEHHPGPVCVDIGTSVVCFGNMEQTPGDGDWVRAVRHAASHRRIPVPQWAFDGCHICKHENDGMELGIYVSARCADCLRSRCHSKFEMIDGGGVHDLEPRDAERRKRAVMSDQQDVKRCPCGKCKHDGILWVHGDGSLAIIEGFCPDCGARLGDGGDVEPRSVDTRQGRLRELLDRFHIGGIKNYRGLRYVVRMRGVKENDWEQCETLDEVALTIAKQTERPFGVIGWYDLDDETLTCGRWKMTVRVGGSEGVSDCE